MVLTRSKRPLLYSAFLGCLLLVVAVSCYWSSKGKDPSSGERVEEETASGPIYFQDVTANSGIKFIAKNGEEMNHLAILESLGQGVGVLDYDGDGLYDVIIIGGGYYDGPDGAKNADKKEIKGYPCRLFKNLGNMKFQDVSEEVGLTGPWQYSHGVAVTDYDRDGWPDILITGWHKMLLYHNEPVDPAHPEKGRKFVERSQEAGLPEGLWTTSAAWADFDGDGFPDLYVCQYVDWSWNKHPPCAYDSKTADVCPPKSFFGLPHHVFRNNGNGTFTDVSRSAGLRMPRTPKDYQELNYLRILAMEETKQGLTQTQAQLEAVKSKDDGKGVNVLEKSLKAYQDELARFENPDYGGHYIEQLKQADKEKDYGKGLGVMTVDVNNDGKPDVYVANDTVVNYLYVNLSEKGKIRFKEIGVAAGVACDDHGTPNGSMGVHASDFNHTGKPSIWVANYENEMHALYVNTCEKTKDGRERIIFNYGTQAMGIAAIGQIYVGFGSVFLDVDNDGWDDIFISNGHAIRFPTGRAKRAQHPILLANKPNERNPSARFFKNISSSSGDYFKSTHTGRGCAVCDFDNDGHADLALCPINQEASLLRNVCQNGNHWLGIELIGKGHRDIVGAKLVLGVDGQELTKFALGGGSYLSANDPRHIFGLGKSDKVGTLTVYWPGGGKQEWKGLATDTYWRLVEGRENALEPKGPIASILGK